MKLTDKAILGMVSESPGRNGSEPIGGLGKKEIRKPSPLVQGQGSMDRRKLTDAAIHSGGVVGQHGDKGMLSNWRNPPRPVAKSAEQEAV